MFPPRCDGQVLLCLLELLQEPVLEDVHFVEVVLTPKLGAVVAGIADVDDGALVDFTLKADIPALDITGTQIRIETIQAAREACGDGIGGSAGLSGAVREGRVASRNRIATGAPKTAG